MNGGEGWRRTELLDWAFWRAERRTERRISPNAHQTFTTACREDPVLWKRPVRDKKDTLDSGQTAGQRWRHYWQLLLVQFDPAAIPLKTSCSVFSSFLRQIDRDGASTQRAEPSSKIDPSRAHQLRHRPDPGSWYRARKRARVWKTKWIRFKQRGRLLQFRKPDRGKRALIHRAVYLPLRYNASGGGVRFIWGKQESGKPGSNSSPGPQTHDSAGTPGPRPERCPWVWRAVLPLDRKQVRQGQNIR